MVNLCLDGSYIVVEIKSSNHRPISYRSHWSTGYCTARAKKIATLSTRVRVVVCRDKTDEEVVTQNECVVNDHSSTFRTGHIMFLACTNPTFVWRGLNIGFASNTGFTKQCNNICHKNHILFIEHTLLMRLPFTQMSGWCGEARVIIQTYLGTARDWNKYLHIYYCILIK